MTADRILGPDEPTQDGDRMTLTLVHRNGAWRSSDGSPVYMTSVIRHDPATVITRPAPPERDWRVGDIVMDANGDVFVRVEGVNCIWRDGVTAYTNADVARPLTRLVPATGDDA